MVISAAGDVDPDLRCCSTMDDRHVALEGCLNLRDLGGYQTLDGRAVRRRCLFRSDALHTLTDDDLEVVAGLGIRVVFDLRNEHERTRWPNRLPDGVELLERTSPVPEGLQIVTIEEQIASGDLPVADDDEFALVYIDLIDRLAPEIRIILDRAVQSPERPLLFHCVAGKDRTGIVAAVVLGLLGVPEYVVLDDYELTSRHFTPARMTALDPLISEHGVDVEHVRTLLQARRPVLETTLRHIDATWGGIEQYAAQHLGVDAELVDRLRAALLVDRT